MPGEHLPDDQWEFIRHAFQKPLPGDVGLVQYVIYDHPTDAPDHYVVRRWEVRMDGSIRDCEGFGYKNLEDAREVIPEWATRLNAAPADQPQILEIWM